MKIREFEYCVCGVTGLYRLGRFAALAVVLAACGKSDPASRTSPVQGTGDGGADVLNADGGPGAATGTSVVPITAGNSGVGGAGMQNAAAGVAGSGTPASAGTKTGAGGSGGGAQPSGCPSGTQCAAPLGALVCTLTSTGNPPTCSAQQPCSFGQCQQMSGQGYCVQNCGPAAVASCAAGSQCINPTGTYYTPTGSFFCSLADTSLPPDCTSQACAYGECLLYGETKSCMQPCKAPAATSCPSGAECTVYGLNTICVKKETGIPPTCNTKADCSYGDCIKTLGQGYCVQYCPTPVNRITGFVESYPPQGGTSLVPVAGVEVCVYNDTKVPCTTTLADGTFVLRGLAGADYYVLSLKKSGYVPTLRLSYTYEVQTVLTATILYTEAQMTASANSVGAKFPDPANGFITFFGTTTTNDTLGLLSGFSATMDPKNGKGPAYINDLGLLDTTLTKASAYASGAYFNVAPGTYKMTFTHPSLKCGDPENVLVAAGYVSANVPAYCE